MNTMLTLVTIAMALYSLFTAPFQIGCFGSPLSGDTLMAMLLAPMFGVLTLVRLIKYNPITESPHYGAEHLAHNKHFELVSSYDFPLVN